MPYSNKKTLLLRFIFRKMLFYTEGVNSTFGELSKFPERPPSKIA